MVEVNLTVTNKSGLHARPAALLTQTASKFNADVTIIKGDREANGKSIVGIIALGANKGQELLFRIDGSDEAELLTAIKDLFANNFGE